MISVIYTVWNRVSVHLGVDRGRYERPGPDAAQIDSRDFILDGARRRGVCGRSAGCSSRAATRCARPGFYLGVHGGYGWGDNNFSQTVFPVPPFAAVQGFKSQGAIYGAQAGYNWQFGRAVTGLEIDFSAANIGGSSATASQDFLGQGTLSGSRFDRVKYLGTTRARLGWLPLDNVLLYGTAGAAWERLDQGQNLSVGPPTNVSVTSRIPSDRLGWVAGAGVEAMLFGPNWIGRLEYLHYDFGAVAEAGSSVSNVANASFSDRAGRQTIDTVRAALSYKFGAPGTLRLCCMRKPRSSRRHQVGPVFISALTAAMPGVKTISPGMQTTFRLCNRAAPNCRARSTAAMPATTGNSAAP